MTKINPIIMEPVSTVVPAPQSYRICWSSIFAGAFVGVGLAFLLHLYAVAIGLSAYSSTEHGASMIAKGGSLGMLLAIIAAMGTAGFVSGYLGRHHYSHIHGGVIYGFITWSLVLIMSAAIAVPLMNYELAYSNSLSRTVSNTPPVKVTNDESAPKLQNTSSSNSAPVVEVTPKDLAWAGWMIFVMFFVGALSSCIGACWAMHCKRHDDEYPHVNTL